METAEKRLRTRTDGIWEIVWNDPKSGKVRRKSTGNRDRYAALQALETFAPEKVDEKSKFDVAYRLRRRSDGIFETAWSDPTTKKVRRKTTGTKDETDAQIKHAANIVAIQAGDAPDSATVGWALDEHLAYVTEHKSPKTAATLPPKIRALKARLGALDCDQVNQNHADGYVAWRTRQKRWEGDKRFNGGIGNVSQSTAASELRMLRAAINRAYKNGFVEQPSKFSIEKGETHPLHGNWLEDHELAQILEACEPRNYVVNGKTLERKTDREHIEAFIMIAVATGARKEAVLSLTWDQVHIPKLPGDYLEIEPKRRIFVADDNRKVLDYHTLENIEGAFIDFGPGSGNKLRPRIPIGQNFELMNYLCFGGDRSQPYVISRNGEPVESVKKGLSTVASEAGIKKKVTHHTFKRTAITRFVRAGIPLREVAKMVQTTEDILEKHYNHFRPDLERMVGASGAIKRRRPT